MVLVNFWRYPDPYQRFLIRIRIRIRPNDTDPTGSGSGSETLLETKLRTFPWFSRVPQSKVEANVKGFLSYIWKKQTDKQRLQLYIIDTVQGG